MMTLWVASIFAVGPRGGGDGDVCHAHVRLTFRHAACVLSELHSCLYAAGAPGLSVHAGEGPWRSECRWGSAASTKGAASCQLRMQ